MAEEAGVPHAGDPIYGRSWHLRRPGEGLFRPYADADFLDPAFLGDWGR